MRSARAFAFRLSAAADGSFPRRSRVTNSYPVSPVAIRMTWTALPITSDGRFSPRGPSGIGHSHPLTLSCRFLGCCLPQTAGIDLPVLLIADGHCRSGKETLYSS
jgi:hypothetical protein